MPAVEELVDLGDSGIYVYQPFGYPDLVQVKAEELFSLSLSAIYEEIDLLKGSIEDVEKQMVKFKPFEDEKNYFHLNINHQIVVGKSNLEILKFITELQVLDSEPKDIIEKKCNDIEDQLAIQLEDRNETAKETFGYSNIEANVRRLLIATDSICIKKKLNLLYVFENKHFNTLI